MSTLIDPSVTTDDHEPSRDELTEGLANLVFAAKREMPVVRRLTTDALTPWDRRHASIDTLLTELEAMDSRA